MSGLGKGSERTDISFSISVLSTGAVFAMFSAFIHWFPLITGVTLHQRWATAHFFMMVAGVNITFFPQHFLGLAGMPRRVPDYPDAFFKWNIVSSVGARVSFFSTLFFLFLLWEALAAQRPLLASCHMPTSLEWKAVVPMPMHNHREMPRMLFYEGKGLVWRMTGRG